MEIRLVQAPPVASSPARPVSGALAARSARPASGRLRVFARGVGEAFAVIAVFVAGGMALAAFLEGAGAGADGGYASSVEPGSPSPRLWLVDGYNVLNVGLLAGREREGWWSSRHRSELLGRVAAFEDREAEIWVVFDGAHPPEASPPARVRSVFAPDADQWLLARIRADSANSVVLVTADRRLAARARHRGAEVVTPRAFLARCGSPLGA